MVLDKVTSLADLAFRGKTNKYYRQLACVAASSYGYFGLTWKGSLEKLNNASLNYDRDSCQAVIDDINTFANEINEDWIEPLEDAKPVEPAKESIWVNIDKDEGWYGGGYQYAHPYQSTYHIWGQPYDDDED